jgi:hypothetical protein
MASEMRRDREDTLNGIGGGLLTYVKSGLAIQANDKFKENLFVQFAAFTVMARCPIHITVVYRPPNSGRENMQQLCELLENQDQNSIVIGDFNLPDISWEAGTAGPKGRQLFNTVEENGLVQLVNFATHSKGNVLDLAIANCPERIISISENCKLGNSDHCIIELLTNIDIPAQQQSREIICWDKANLPAMRSQMDQINWEVHFCNKNAEQCWATFREILTRCADEHIPKRTVKNKTRQKWVTREIIRLVRMKKRRWREYRRQPNNETKAAYEDVEGELKKKIKRAKRKKERELVNGEDRNGKKFTNYIKSKTKARTGIGPLKKADGTLTTDGREMADILNGFFSSVFTKEDLTNLPTKNRETNKLLTDIVINERLVVKKIDKLKKDSAPGPDNIHPRLLKELKHQVARPLVIIFNKSLATGIVPRDWKKAKVVPIYKKGPKSDAGNYRPVSLTSVPCKILESIIKDAVMKHLEEEQLINDSQHGFMPGRSCTTNLTIFLDELSKVVDEGKAADVFYLDFAKAFDKVAHQRLIIKVKAKGIDGNVARWLEEWRHR